MGSKNAHGFDRYSQDIPAFPAQWFGGLYVLSPVSSLYLSPLPGPHGQAGSTPGSRRQDHTISPYAAGVSSDGHDPPDAAASIATRATFRDDRETSLMVARAGRIYASDLPDGARENYDFHITYS